MKQLLALSSVVLSLTPGFCYSFGSPKTYFANDKVDLFINKVQSDNNQLPYSYYELPFTCDPVNTTQIPLSLGQIFRGDRVVRSDAELRFLRDADCFSSCVAAVGAAASNKANFLISHNYTHEWIIDGLPAATTMIDHDSNAKYYSPGFPVGYKSQDHSYLFNHIMLVIRYHEETPGQYSIVGVEAYPRSVKKPGFCPGARTGYEPLEMGNEGVVIDYSYAVYWREERSVTYHDRWNQYYNSQESNILHYLSLIYSSICVLAFSTAVAFVLAQMLKKDAVESWRGLKSKVFSRPQARVLLALLTGAGYQLLVTFSCVITLFAFRILDNNVPGRTLSYAIFLFVGAGMVSGFTASYIALEAASVESPKRKKINPMVNPDWFHVSMLAGAVMPGFVICAVLFLNFIVWAKESSTALPFGTILVLIGFYIFLEIPLALIGGYLANKECLKREDARRHMLPVPVTSPVSSPALDKFHHELNSWDPKLKHKPPLVQPWYFHPLYRSFVFGAAPFVCIYIELLYIYKAIWLEKSSFYYLYGFLLVTLILVLILVAESVILALYLQLNSGDYRWQWNSFAIGGSVANYVLMYSVGYYIKHLYSQYDFVSGLLYFVYCFLIYLLMLLSLGAVGVTTGWYFVRKVYKGMKYD